MGSNGRSKMTYSSLCLLSSGSHYVVLGIWWYVQIIKKYWNSKHRKIDFSSSLHSSGRSRLNRFAVEGILKLLAGLCVLAICWYQIYTTENTLHQKQAMGQLTVFTLFGLSSIWDIVLECCHRVQFSGVDYVFVVLCFNIQSLMLSYHNGTHYMESWTAVAEMCAMYSATGVAIAAMLEYQFKHYVWFPLMRSYLTLILGTWLIHISFEMIVFFKDSNEHDRPTAHVGNMTIESSTVDVHNEISAAHSDLEKLLHVPIYFSIHCLLDMSLLIGIWIIVWKLANRKCCACIPDEKVGFENHVHFQYHMIDTMTDLDIE